MLLREKSTGRTAYFLNTHNPANVRGNAAHYRAQAIAIEKAKIIQLRATGRPVFLTGDFNDRQAAFCPLTANKLAISPNSIPSDDLRLPQAERRSTGSSPPGRPGSRATPATPTRRAPDQRPPDRLHPGTPAELMLTGSVDRPWVGQRQHADSHPLPPTVAAGSAARRVDLRRAPGRGHVARRAIGNADGRVPDSTGWYGRGRPGPAIKIALLGDSSAAGYGVDSVEQTPGAWLGSGVAERAGRRVHLREFAVVGAQSSDLAGQVTRRCRPTPTWPSS